MRFNCGRTGGDGGGSSGAGPVGDDAFDPPPDSGSAPAGRGAAGACDGSAAVLIGRGGESPPAGRPSGTAESLPRRRDLDAAERGVRPASESESTARRSGAEAGAGLLSGAAALGPDKASAGAARAGFVGAPSAPVEDSAPAASAWADGSADAPGGCAERGTSLGRDAGRAEGEPAAGAALLAPLDSGAPRSGTSARGFGTSNALPWPVS